MRRTNIVRTACFLTAALGAGAAAWADFTTIPQKSGQSSKFAEIFEAYYSAGQDWTATGERYDSAGNLVDFTNGNLTASRIADFGYPGSQGAGSVFGEATDQSWIGAAYTFTAVARYASYTQEFGYSVDGDDAGYTKLFDLSGSGMNVTGSASLALPSWATLAWHRSGNKGGLWSSRPEDNSDGVDHLAAYRVSGFNDGVARWMLFWEDLPNGGDKDYTDLVLEISTVQRCVPEPGVGLMLLACGIGVIRRR